MATNDRFRNILPFVVPRWLSTGEGEKVLYTLGMMKDAATERLRQGLEARFPTRTNSETALTLIGENRKIPRGRDETSSHYAQRLKAWRYPRGHRVRGNAFALLEQVYEYWGGLACYTVDRRGNKNSRDADGNESHSTVDPWEWDTLPVNPNWSRFWLVIDAGDVMGENPDLGDPELWGGSLYDPEYTVGQTGATSQDTIAIRALFTSSHPWKPAASRIEWIIIDLDGTEQTPDPTWENWSKDNGDHRIASRYSGWRYWAGDRDRNVYSPTGAKYYTKTILVDESLYTPTGAAYESGIPMPDGSTYTPAGGTYTTPIQMIDDGDTPV